MPTKLKQPITITIHHVENAICAAMLHFERPRTTSLSIHRNLPVINDAALDGEVFDQITSALKSQCIDWNTWLPEPPFKVAGHEAVFNPDGSVKVGCTTISASEIAEILKRRDKAMVVVNSAQSEWPKFYDNRAGVVWVARSESDLGMFISASDGSRSESLSRPTAMRWCADCKYKRLTRAEAARILGISEADL